MRLLFDQNLSPRLVQRLKDLYRDSLHVSSVGLDRATDGEVWAYAMENECAIVTKDSDFSDRGAVMGIPPKVIWLRLGNCSTDDVEATLRRVQADINTFLADPELGLMEVI